MIEVDGLLNEIEGALFHGGDGFVDGTVSGDENDGKRGFGGFCLAQDFDAGMAGEL